LADAWELEKQVRAREFVEVEELEKVVVLTWAAVQEKAGE